jgi:plasmid stabilization system protein ParE
MSRSLRFHPEAESDLGDAADHYALQCPGLDQRFIAEIELALAQIVAFPEASSPGNAGPGARSCWATPTRSYTR